MRNWTKDKRWILAGVAPLLVVGWLGWRAHSPQIPLAKSSASARPDGKRVIPNGMPPATSRVAERGSASTEASENGEHLLTVVTPMGTAVLTEAIPLKSGEAAPGCFTVAFRHQELATHGSEDECSHHRNLIRLPRADANPASVCIRVGGVPARHERVPGHADELVIGAVAGPHDTITASYCIGQSSCAEACRYPVKEAVKKDEFLAAIGGDNADGPELAQGGWQAADGEKSAEVARALDPELRRELDGEEAPAGKTAPGAGPKLPVFAQWLGEAPKARSCGRNLAAGR